MVSHGEVSGIKLTLGAGGLRFRKKPTKFNRCVGKEMRGVTGSQKEIQTKFEAATKKC